MSDERLTDINEILTLKAQLEQGIRDAAEKAVNEFVWRTGLGVISVGLQCEPVHEVGRQRRAVVSRARIYLQIEG